MRLRVGADRVVLSMWREVSVFFGLRGDGSGAIPVLLVSERAFFLFWGEI